MMGLGLPVTTGEINHYLNGGMDYLGGLSPYSYNTNLSIPKLNTLSVDAFNSTAKQVDKRGSTWKYFCLYLGAVTAAVFGARKCLGNTAEFAKDTANLIGNGTVKTFKSIGDGICAPFRWIGSKFNKNK